MSSIFVAAKAVAAANTEGKNDVILYGSPLDSYNLTILIEMLEAKALDNILSSFDFNIEQMAIDLLRIVIAFTLALPIAWERSCNVRRIGLRTFPIVAIASCGFMLVTQSLSDAGADAQTRVLQGLLTGIGFIGGGAILKTDFQVVGLATAASIWNTAAIGAAVALHREEIAFVLSVINYATLRLLTPLKHSSASKEGDTSIPID